MLHQWCCSGVKVVVGMGVLSPMINCAFCPSEMRSCGLASSSASVLFLMKLRVTAEGSVKANERWVIDLNWSQLKLPAGRVAPRSVEPPGAGKLAPTE